MTYPVIHAEPQPVCVLIESFGLPRFVGDVLAEQVTSNVQRLWLVIAVIDMPGSSDRVLLVTGVQV